MKPFQIRITEPNEKLVRFETFADGAVNVCSHSGLSAVEKAVLHQLPKRADRPSHLLVAGNRTGVTAMCARFLFPECAVTTHAFDLHHCRSIAKNLKMNGYPSLFLKDEFATAYDVDGWTTDEPDSQPVRLACTAQIPAARSEDGRYDFAVFTYTPGLMTAELLLDQLEDIHQNLRVGGKILLAAETQGDPLFKQLREIFGNYTVLSLGNKKRPHCVLSLKQAELKKPRSFSATFQSSVPGHDPVSFVSLPGVFCHRRPDMGGLALSEVVTKELANFPPNPDGSLQLLDMGCGCGLVGILVATSTPITRVAFVDSHARALEATRRNAEAAGLKDIAVYVLSDTGAPQRGYDIFVGNPPYYSEYRIADIFLDTAFQILHRKGLCYTVAKTETALGRHQKEVFGNVTVLPRRNYAVLRSTR
ncbi:MAG: methyltransferase [Kiritimatiellae bacterium]|nr:methyltransferase [Kiritimatiellia bacterium]